MAVAATTRIPTHVIAHLSDPHLLADGTLLHGRIDTAAQLRAALHRVESTDQRIDLLVLSGDLTDTGDPAAYRLLRELVEPVAARLHAAVVWTGGNHDERRPLAQVLFGVDTDAPQDTVTTVRGLRVIALDTAVPGHHDGGLSDEQLDWLARQLATPAPHGTVLVMHHPPIAYHSPWMQLLDFREPDRLRAMIGGSDVRAILGGHLHVTSFGTLGTVPVFVAGGVCYVDDAGAPPERLMALDGPQSWNLVEVHDDQVVGSVVPVARSETWPALNDEVRAYLAAVPTDRRRAVFARKHPPPDRSGEA
ncbi:metallophosphoesterase [Intrasporangium sp.]|uniref:metallophosphoesterase n=1 Tax=Intrasporangium sp. TaxID=1925024 RepID=UPI003221CD05